MSQEMSSSDGSEERYLKFRRFFIRRARRALWTVKNKITPSQVLRLVDHPGRAQAYLVRGYFVKVIYVHELGRLKLIIIKRGEPKHYQVHVYCRFTTVMIEDDSFSMVTRSALRGG